MRVIGGEFRSRRLKTPPGMSLRPTSDRLRETLFNILGGEVQGKIFLDAYAGSGAVGIEALSRGAARAIFIENNRKAASVLRENLRSLGLERRSEIIGHSVVVALDAIHADIAFLDPPYVEAREYEASLDLLGNANAGRPLPALVVAEHSSRVQLKPAYGALQRVRVLKQGDSSLSFYRRAPGAAPEASVAPQGRLP